MQQAGAGTISIAGGGRGERVLGERLHDCAPQRPRQISGVRQSIARPAVPGIDLGERVAAASPLQLLGRVGGSVPRTQPDSCHD